jgi:DNA-binding transcriptional LysR family regulator
MTRMQPGGRKPAQIATRRLRSAPPKIAAATLKPVQLLALQAFDVAVRSGSFKATAQALNVSASAVSHRIRNLEQTLGTALFVRTHRAIHPTVAGRTLAAATGRAFAELARTGLPTGSSAGRQRLRLKVFPLFASAWLIPRLAGFVAKHPDIDLAIETSSYAVDFDVEAYDAGNHGRQRHVRGAGSPAPRPAQGDADRHAVAGAPPQAPRTARPRTRRADPRKRLSQPPGPNGCSVRASPTSSPSDRSRSTRLSRRSMPPNKVPA